MSFNACRWNKWEGINVSSIDVELVIYHGWVGGIKEEACTII